jgi:hypothetical protein
MTSGQATSSGHDCRQLLALLAMSGAGSGDAADADADELARRLEEHAASCPECRACEADLHALLQRYGCTAAPPLDAALETRLLDRLCARFPG